MKLTAANTNKFKRLVLSFGRALFMSAAIVFVFLCIVFIISALRHPDEARQILNREFLKETPDLGRFVFKLVFIWIGPLVLIMAIYFWIIDLVTNRRRKNSIEN